MNGITARARAIHHETAIYKAGDHDPVKCNIHNWMHAHIGVVDHPYFAVRQAMEALPFPICARTYTLKCGMIICQPRNSK